ncbi:helix-turn-helix domain-containing protein [Butyrivibrio sp. INlla18]|uniref:helix-turn-helix domain-containing protein n=1 Tax=Butyrivibrio sp. INlla18 TaxID=1520806 RepID=UPI000B86C7F0|nr:helix-turn-helix domain-containing protein [Butyrivibrio sp. INlla18]
MVLKNETQGNFVMVSQNILHDKTLKLFDRGLLITLMSLPDNWNFTINGLATILDDGRDAIRAGLDRLQEKGYLVKEQLRTNGKFADICIRINVVPKQPLLEKTISENPSTEKPSTEKPITEKPVSGIPTQLYIQESKKQESKNHKSNTHKYVEADRKGAEHGTADGTDRNRTDRKSAGSGESSGWSKNEIDLYGL